MGRARGVSVSHNSSMPAYNLSAVIRETGIKPDTLRAWERRYGLPQPDRTPGGHRLYSSRDVETVKWLLARRKEGMSISRAVALWRELEGKGEDPLNFLNLPAARMAPTVMPAQPALEALRRSWLRACSRFDEARAQALLDQAFALAAPERVCLDVLQRGLAEAGERWYQGDLHVVHEHFITAQAVRRLEALRNAAPAPSRQGAILLLCPPGERHTFPVLLLDFLLRRRGFPIVYLGADTPAADLAPALGGLHPVLAVAGAQTLPAAAGLAQMAPTLGGLGIPLAFGGWIFNRVPSLHLRMGGHFLGSQIPQALENIDALHANPSPPSSGPAEPSPWRAAAQRIRARQPDIHATLRQQPGLGAIPEGLMEAALRFLCRSIRAALLLDDPQPIALHCQWITEWLSHRKVPHTAAQRLPRLYLQALQQSLEDHPDLHPWLTQGLSAADAPGTANSQATTKEKP